MLRLQYDANTFDADLVRQRPGGPFVAEGGDLETLALVSLLSDARAEPGEDMPEDTPRRGYWGDVFEPQGERVGSLLWLLERATASELTAQRAEGYARDALAWLARDARVRAIRVSSEVVEQAVYLHAVLVLSTGDERRLGPIRVTR